MEKKRYAVLDILRGLTLISMMIFHGVWNIVYIFGEPWLWYKSEAAYWWQQSICWSFILLSGFCWSFGKRRWKRGITVFLAGAVVSLVTFAVMPQNIVLFGILTCLGTCMLAMCVIHPLFRNISPILGGSSSFLSFLLVRNINRGSLGFGAWSFLELPKSWYANSFTAYMGCPPDTFFSTDYFSIFPWLFLFLTGYFIHCYMRQKDLLVRLEMPGLAPIWKPFEWMGKHSLLIYLLHQPIIYGIMCLCYQ